MCEKVGIDTNQDINKLAVQLADLIDKDMKVGPGEPSIMTEAFAPQKRKPAWKNFMFIRLVLIMKFKTQLQAA